MGLTLDRRDHKQAEEGSEPADHDIATATLLRGAMTMSKANLGAVHLNVMGVSNVSVA